MEKEAAVELDEQVRLTSLKYARELVNNLENKNYIEADNIINHLSSVRETSLYQEVGKLTRGLHEKIKDFTDGTQIHTLMQEGIPDAQERLSHVIKLTEESAHSTMTAVEQAMPKVSDIELQAKQIISDLDRYLLQQDDTDGLDPLVSDLDKVLQQVIENTSFISRNLSDILMAQSYQDITGQVIQRVINLVQDVELSLVDIIKSTGVTIDASTKSASNNNSDDNKNGFGPAVPGVTKGEVMQSQEDVDDLLSNLGF